MAISPNGKFLYAALEGPTVADNAVDPLLRYIFEFSIKDEEFTGRTWQYHVENTANLVADMDALDRHHLVLIERDAGSGVTALFRNVYEIDLRDVDAAGFVEKKVRRRPDARSPTRSSCRSPRSIPATSDSATRSGSCANPSRRSTTSDDDRIMIGCDNNLPNKGRNPNLADDNEFIVVDVPGLD